MIPAVVTCITNQINFRYSSAIYQLFKEFKNKHNSQLAIDQAKYATSYQEVLIVTKTKTQK